MLKTKPYGYSFPPGSILQPGETMRVYTQGDPARTPSSTSTGA